MTRIKVSSATTPIKVLQTDVRYLEEVSGTLTAEVQELRGKLRANVIGQVIVTVLLSLALLSLYIGFTGQIGELRGKMKTLDTIELQVLPAPGLTPAVPGKWMRAGCR